MTPRTLEQSHDHGGVAGSHDHQRQEEARVLQNSNGQSPVVRVDAVIIVGAGEAGGVAVLRHGEKHHIGHGNHQADQPQRNAHQVHHPPPSVLQVGDGVDDRQVPIDADARQQEAPAQEVELPHQTHQLAEKVAEYPTDGVLQDDERERGQEQEVGHGQVQQVDLADAQETPAAQEDGHHQAISHHTQQEETAVKDGFKDGLKALQTAVLIAAVRHVVFCENVIWLIVGFSAKYLRTINKT